MDTHVIIQVIVAVVLTAVIILRAVSSIGTSVEVKGNELIFRSPLSTKRYKIKKVLENDALVGSILKHRIIGIDLPSKKIGKFRTKYGNARVYCTTPYCVVLETDGGIVVVDSSLFNGGESNGVPEGSG